jgi:opacity protein-like surface antigen
VTPLKTYPSHHFAIRLLLLAVLLLFLPHIGFAQNHFEVQPFVGYKWGGTTDVAPNVLAIQRLKFDSSVAYGVSAAYNMNHVGLEFLWNRQPTKAAAELFTGSNLRQKTSVDLDQFHGNILYNFGGSEAKLQPFVLVGFGATRIAGAGDSITKFSYALGGGVKYPLGAHMGLRLQIRYAPTYLYSTADGVWCNWYGFCFVASNDHFLHQGDATAGIYFRF